MNELFMYVQRGLLHVRSHHQSVVTEILVKGITVPATFHLHDVEWEPSEEVFESGSNMDGMTLNLQEASNRSCFQYSGSKCFLGHWYHSTLIVQVSE